MNCLPIFMRENGEGLALFLLSAFLSRGVDHITDDMDDKGITLIGAHCYCTQELVKSFLEVPLQYLLLQLSVGYALPFFTPLGELTISR